MTDAIHATAVAFGRNGVLIRGAPGAGKSSLALRLIDEPGYGLSTRLLHGRLVADDQVILLARDGKLRASPPAALAGKLEIRGQGIVSVPFAAATIIRLVVDLQPFDSVERLPQDIDIKDEILGIGVPRIRLDGHMAAAPACLRAAFSRIVATHRQEA